MADKKTKFDQESAFKSIIGMGNENPKEATKEKIAGKGRPREERETKKRISLAVLPSIYEDIQKISYIDRTSVSEIVSNFFQQYVKDNANKIKEYDELKGN